MRAALRSLHSPDIPDLPSWQPDIADDFGFLLQIIAGPANGEGAESFDVTVCTPKWLERHHAASDIVPGRHHLIVFAYDYSILKSYIERMVHAINGRNWPDVARELSELGHWEFEGYRKRRN
jgi:hypothetical protein